MLSSPEQTHSGSKPAPAPAPLPTRAEPSGAGCPRILVPQGRMRRVDEDYLTLVGSRAQTNNPSPSTLGPRAIRHFLEPDPTL